MRFGQLMRIIFMGSSDFSCRCLDALARCSNHLICLVVTQPDKPKGRHLVPSPSAMRKKAEEMGLPVMTAEDVNSSESEAALASLKPDVIVVVAFGQILKKNILTLPPRGCVNVHASLLPRYRGAAPIQWAILKGEKVTGVTVISMNERLDAGDILGQKQVDIEEDDTAGTLHDRLATAGGEILAHVLDGMEKGNVLHQKQDDALATFAPKLRREDGRIEWGLSAADLHLRVRAFNPWPGCFAAAPDGEGNVKIWRTRTEAGTGQPGEILEISDEGPLVATGDGALRLLEVQPEGKKRMDGASYVRGRRLAAGMRFR